MFQMGHKHAKVCASEQIEEDVLQIRVDERSGPVPLKFGDKIHLGDSVSIEITTVQLQDCVEFHDSPEDHCYICLASAEDSTDKLIRSPCKCGMAVHQGCLAESIKMCQHRFCTVCQHKFPLACVQKPHFIGKIKHQITHW
eukprot:TRINITY_DN3017_c0_g1_i1.p1 TRINITY_DN3017_c0_g1~~TRINITY_DN3017_c0_g1_i1.p1  ORF type:complete len:141 (-),score=30.85 TRINITY_DN3017_c0_g1_i1:53-475(-)